MKCYNIHVVSEYYVCEPFEAVLKCQLRGENRLANT
jgi:hypothetical protein